MTGFIKNGETVEIKGSGVRGTVIGVCIRGVEPGVSIEYHVQWLAGGTLHNSWLFSHTVERYVETKKQAGLVNYDALPTETE